APVGSCRQVRRPLVTVTTDRSTRGAPIQYPRPAQTHLVFLAEGGGGYGTRTFAAVSATGGRGEETGPRSERGRRQGEAGPGGEVSVDRRPGRERVGPGPPAGGHPPEQGDH